jgi:general secretion pathway protein M
MMALWWKERSQREQWLLGLMGGLLLVVLLWLGAWRPAVAARQDAMARHGAAVLALGQVRAMAGEIRAAEARGGAAQGLPLIELITQRAQAAGLTMERLESPGDGVVEARIGAVRPAVLLGWLSGLEGNDAIIIDRLSISRNADASVAVNLTLRRGAR